MAERRQCIFCGGSPVTVEHVMPQWLADVVPGKGGAGFALGRKDVGDEDSFQIVIKKKMPVEARRPCAPCNNGWMKDLEDQARPWLTPMIKDQPVVIPVFAQRWLGTWAVKTTTFIRYSETPPASTPDDRNRWLFASKTPPPASFVFLARYGGSMPEGGWWHRLAMNAIDDGPMDEEVNVIALRIGQCVMLVIEFFEGTPESITLPEEWRRALLRVWPTDDDAVSWPPSVWLTDNGLKSLVRLFGDPQPHSR